jgi:hypothetical protein
VPTDRTDVVDSEGETADTGDTSPSTRWEGANGFGFSLVWHDGAIWTGNPNLGEVTTLDGSIALSGPGDYGWSLASTPAGLAVGAPLAGVIYLDEEPLDAGNLAGGRMVSEGDSLAWTVLGGVTVDGSTSPRNQQPSAMTFQDGELVISFSRGADVFPGRARGEDDGDLGYALCASEDLLAVSAPGVDQVLLITNEGEELFTAEGRFGHALSCGPDEVVVGAPMSGSVWLLRPGEDAELLTREAGLGESVLLTPEGDIYAGTPGNTSSSGGSVVRLR